MQTVPGSVFDVAAELGAVAFTLAVVYGFGRLFEGFSFFAPVAITAVASHLVAIAIRWMGAGLIVSSIASVAGFAATAWFLFPPTPQPDASMLSNYGTELGLAWDQFQTVSAPTVANPPFLLIVAIAIWVVAFLSDWAAFRLRSPAESLIPGFAVFVFGAFFAAEQLRVASTAFIVATALAAVLFQRASAAEHSGTWLNAESRTRGQNSLVKIGAVVLAFTLIGGVGVAQALPGYNEPPLDNFDPTTWNDPVDPRVVVSPLVNIQSRLINQPDLEVFTVQSPTRDYWRLTSLDVFDGDIWRSRGSFEGADSGLSTSLPNGTTFQTVEQTYNISALAQIWLPAAYEPTEIIDAPDDIGFEYEAASGTLIVNRAADDSDGLSYTLRSQVPLRDDAGIDAIQNAGSNIPDEIAERYLQLPDGFSTRVSDLAAEVTAEATTPYGQALALQQFFRDPELFSYSLEVQKGHGNSNIEDFLFENNAGYCEQFAGSFAAMARSIGLPSRVAVGFTPGDYDPATDTYTVTGKHAHAWPEVWLDGVGWLRFEPTPGRGGPGDQAYTGQPEAQVGATAPSPDVDLNDPNSPGFTPPTSVNPQQPPGPTTTTIPEFGGLGNQPEVTTGVVGGTPSGLIATVSKWLAGFSLLALVGLSPLLYGQWRASRQTSAVSNDPRRRVGLAWDSSKAAVQLLGVPVSNSETAREIAAKVENKARRGLDDGAVETAATSLLSLADAIDEATYSGSELAEDKATEAEQISKTLAATARNSFSTKDWWLHHMNPLNVWRDKVGAWGNLRPKN